jgi:DNA-binding response OmpR family regulator
LNELLNKLEFIILDDDKGSNFLTEESILDELPNASIRTFYKAIQCLEYLTLNNGTRILLIDINMPSITGWEFIKELQERNLQERIIILTASSNEDDKIRATKEGVHFMNKPINVEELKMIISRD